MYTKEHAILRLSKKMAESRNITNGESFKEALSIGIDIIDEIYDSMKKHEL